jgi:hypothetical protein
VFGAIEKFPNRTESDLAEAVLAQPPIGFEAIVDDDDVRMHERAGEPRLAQEAAREPRVRHRLQLLERHQPVEAGLPGEIHDGHAAAPDLAQDRVATDMPEGRRVRVHDVRTARRRRRSWPTSR